MYSKDVYFSILSCANTPISVLRSHRALKSQAHKLQRQTLPCKYCAGLIRRKLDEALYKTRLTANVQLGAYRKSCYIVTQVFPHIPPNLQLCANRLLTQRAKLLATMFILNLQFRIDNSIKYMHNYWNWSN